MRMRKFWAPLREEEYTGGRITFICTCFPEQDLCNFGVAPASCTLWLDHARRHTGKDVQRGVMDLKARLDFGAGLGQRLPLGPDISGAFH